MENERKKYGGEKNFKAGEEKWNKEREIGNSIREPFEWMTFEMDFDYMYGYL